MVQLLKAKYTVIAITIVVVILIILSVYFTGKKAGKQGKIRIIDLPSDNGGTIDPNKIRRIATELYNDMYGYNYRGHDMRAYQDFAMLSDTEFVAVYNDYNNQYYSLGSGTLKEWIMDEMFFDELIDDIILPRMAKLNLN